MWLTGGLAKAYTLLASPLNKNIFVVRLGRKCHHDLAAFAKPLTLCVTFPNRLLVEETS
jgi:hypothetical protein